jgi:transposase
MENELQAHYALLLGIKSPWQVERVDLQMAAQRVEIRLEWQEGRRPCCPECGREVGIHDWAPERAWRHLDTMQFETILRARTPRCNCPEHGVKTVTVPWAEPHGRFTALFERWAVAVLLAARSVTQAAGLLRLSWDEVHHIMERAVRRGLQRRELEQLRYVGIDEKNFLAGQSYVSVLTDLEGRRVLEVVAHRTRESAQWLWETLSPAQRKKIAAVAMDMWEPYLQATQAQAPQAAIVHDKFHISAHLNEAVDRVRRAEHKALLAAGDATLTGSKQLWLMNPLNMDAEQRSTFRQLRDSELKVARAWAAKELFTKLWTYRYEGSARKFVRQWWRWISRSQLKPLIKVARMILDHLDNILTYLKHPITNAVTEGLNSRIQEIKANARGFRSFENYRLRILFYCGKLDLFPR